MISRLTASAAVFAFLVTTGLAVAADNRAAKSTAIAAEPATTIVLPKVEITGQRHAQP